VFASGLVKDLGGGGGHVSKLYKLAVVLTVLVYAAVIGYSTSLTLVVLGHHAAVGDAPPLVAAVAAVTADVAVNHKPAAEMYRPAEPQPADAHKPKAVAEAAASGGGGGGGGGGGDDDDGKGDDD